MSNIKTKCLFAVTVQASQSLSSHVFATMALRSMTCTVMHWPGLSRSTTSASAENVSPGRIHWERNTHHKKCLRLWFACVQVGGEQLERVLKNLWGGIPVSSSSMLEDAVTGPGQLGLQWTLHHGRPGAAHREAALQKPCLWSTVGGGRVDRGMSHAWAFPRQKRNRINCLRLHPVSC